MRFFYFSLSKMKYSSKDFLCKRLLPFLFLSFMVIVFYAVSLKVISANREEPVLAFKSQWLSDQSLEISFGELFYFYVNKYPPKLVFDFDGFKLPFILFPQHGPLSSIPPYLMYKIGSEYSVSLMRLTGVIVGLLILLILLKDSLTLSFLLYTNAFLLFVFSYTSLFWYVCMLLFCVLYIKSLNGLNKYFIFSISALGAASHVRFPLFSLIFALVFWHPRRVFWTLLGNLLGLSPYLILSLIHKSIQIDRRSLEILFAPPSDITKFVLNYFSSGSFNLLHEITNSVKSFSYLFFSFTPFSDLGILKTENSGILRFLAAAFFIFVFFSALRYNIRYFFSLVLYILLTPLSNPSGLFNFTKMPWQFLLILPVFYSLILNANRFFIYLIIFSQILFSFLVLRNIAHSKTQFSRSEVREVVNFLESGNIQEVLNIGLFSSIPLESAGKINTVEALYFFYTKPQNYVFREISKFDYIIVSQETDDLIGKILVRMFEPIFTTSGGSIKVYKKKPNFYLQR